MTVIVSQQIKHPSFVLLRAPLRSTDVPLPDSSCFAVRILVREAASALPVELHLDSVLADLLNANRHKMIQESPAVAREDALQLLLQLQY